MNRLAVLVLPATAYAAAGQGAPFGHFDRKLEAVDRLTATKAMAQCLGAIPMQDMDVLIDPRDERLILPPDRPNFAFAKIK